MKKIMTTLDHVDIKCCKHLLITCVHLYSVMLFCLDINKVESLLKCKCVWVVVLFDHQLCSPLHMSKE